MVSPEKHTTALIDSPSRLTASKEASVFLPNVTEPGIGKGGENREPTKEELFQMLATNRDSKSFAEPKSAKMNKEDNGAVNSAHRQRKSGMIFKRPSANDGVD